MLKNLSTSLKKEHFTLEDGGENHELYVSQYTVDDANHLLELQKAELADGDTISYENFVISRIIAGVKRVEDDSRFWDCTIDEFSERNYPNDLVSELTKAVNELNPIPMLNEGETALGEKKSKS